MNPTDPQNNLPSSNSDKNREVAADIIRGQLNSLFSNAPEEGQRPSTTDASTVIVNDKVSSATPTPTSPIAQTASTTSTPQSSSTSNDLAEEETFKNAKKRPDIGPYERTYVERSPEIRKKEWAQYQSAWQDYYQNYYEKYYTHHYEAAQKALKRQKAGIVASRQIYQDSIRKKNIAASAQQQQQIETPKTTTQTAEEAKAIQQAPAKKETASTYFGANQSAAARNTQLISEEEASKRLRKKIQSKISSGAEKVKKSRHFMPLMASSLAVVLFLFLQFNQLVISNVVAYVSPGNIDPQNIVIETPENITVDPVARLIIPKINVDVPVHYDIGNDTKSQNAAMRDGLAHFSIPGANSHPGETGNTVIAGHSSGDIFMNSDYKFIFAQLHKLEAGDKIYANYNSKRYTYVVTNLEVVYPEQVDKLVYDTAGKPVMTLITCTPLGTALQRLLVTAEQISPDPLKATAATVTATDTGAIPGNEPTWIEKIITNMFGSDHN